VCACTRDIFLFNKTFFFPFDKPANRKFIQRLVGITAKKKKYLANVTSIIDDRPGSRIFLNTWIISLFFASQMIMLETQKTVYLKLTFGRTTSQETGSIISDEISRKLSYSCPTSSKFLPDSYLYMVTTTPDIQNYNISNISTSFFVR